MASKRLLSGLVFSVKLRGVDAERLCGNCSRSVQVPGPLEPEHFDTGRPKIKEFVDD